MFFENLGLLIETWGVTEVWTIGKITMSLVTLVWVAGVISFFLWYLGKKILGK